MSSTPPREILVDPDLGELPARRVLECVFVLRPDGPILHHHLEELRVEEGGERIVYTPSGQPAAAERARCQIIPPRVTEFDRSQI